MSSKSTLRNLIREIIKESYYDGLPLKHTSIKQIFKKAYQDFPDRKHDLDIIQEVWQLHDNYWWFTRDEEPDDKGFIRASHDLINAAKRLLEIDLSEGIPEKDPEPIPEKPGPDDDEYEISNKERRHRHAREDWQLKNVNPQLFIRKLISNMESTLTKNYSWDIKFSHILSNVHRAVERSLADIIGDQSIFSIDPRVLDNN